MDDEIIIERNIQNNTKNTKSNKNINRKKIKKQNHKNNNSELNKKRKVKKIKIFFLLIIFLILLLFIFSSSLFNIKNIEVEGNNRISKEKIISISSLDEYTNIFKFNKSAVIENIKQNAYIENVKIIRSLPSTVKITIEEREPKYMLQFADSYVYINNQGYMLEISNEKLDNPILIGFTTDLSNIKAGNRINVDDLKKLQMVIKIYEIAKTNDLGELISKIDISNDKNYTLILDSEQKTVYLGDCSNLNTKMLYLKSILEYESSKGRAGEIFLNVDLNSEEVYFRPSN